MSNTKPLATEKWWDATTVAVVTGSNKGIGYEIARLLAEQGLKTVVTARNVDAGQDAAERIKSATGSSNVMFHQLDITDAESVDAFADWAESALGSVTVLVNNAGRERHLTCCCGFDNATFNKIYTNFWLCRFCVQGFDVWRRGGPSDAGH
jgi:NAD(P)-dependent dehydrogenase (short-subunit alcohol dehydrogenase family)